MDTLSWKVDQKWPGWQLRARMRAEILWKVDHGRPVWLSLARMRAEPLRKVGQGWPVWLLRARMRAETKEQKPGTAAGFFVTACNPCASAYPAKYRYSVRRAREVIPAAARALVRMIGWM